MRRYLDGGFSKEMEENFSEKEDYNGLEFEDVFYFERPIDLGLMMHYRNIFYSKRYEPYDFDDGEGLRKFVLPYPYKSENKSPYVYKPEDDTEGEGSILHTRLDLTEIQAAKIFIKYAMGYWRSAELPQFLEYHYQLFRGTNLKDWLNCVRHLIGGSDHYDFENHLQRLKFQKEAKDWIAEKRKELAELEGDTPMEQPQTVETANVEVEPKRIEPPKPKNDTAFFYILYFLSKEILKDGFEPFELRNSTTENEKKLEIIAKWAMKKFNYECRLDTLKDYLSKSDKTLDNVNTKKYHSNILEFITYHYPNKSPTILFESHK